MQLKSFSVPQEFFRHRIVVKAMHVHALGLTHPGHMEWTTSGRLLVSEFGRGRIVDITAPDDYRDAPAFAWGLGHPAALVTDFQGSRIIVADSGNDAIYDITAGGDFSNATPIFSGIPAPYGMTVFRNELYATYTSHQDNGLTKVVGSNFQAQNHQLYGLPSGISEHPYILARSGGCGSWTATIANDRLLYCLTFTGTIFDATNAGRFDRAMHERFAWGLRRPVGMIHNTQFQSLFVAEIASGTVKAVPDPGGFDVQYIPPIATGMKEPRCVRFSPDNKQMFVCDMSSCCVWRMDIEVL